ncbi:MAG: PAS domain S-box protein [Acidobacteriota bacterium]|nr:PAS domain S-box protein [Acidobacteriota bacterium]
MTKSMPTKLKVLLLEDNSADVEFVLHELRRAGYDPEWKRVETEPEFLAQLDQGWDIVLADYNLPEFDGLRALKALRKRDPDLPFILVTGTIGEEMAVATMKVGANDFIMKDKLARLGPAVEREMRDASGRRERKRAEEGLRRAEENFRRFLDESPLGVRIVDAQGKTLYANHAILDLYGFAGIEELVSTPVEERYTSESLAEHRERNKTRRSGEPDPSDYEITIVRKNGEFRRLHVLRKTILWDGRSQSQVTYQDITERKKAEAEVLESLAGLRKALNGTIQVLSAVSEIRDPYTAGHQRRVGDLARAIAQGMGLGPARVEGIRVGGVIHDIGKLSIPAEILSKPTRLAKIEYEMIKAHPQIGFDILGGIDFAWPLAEMALQHHERMDGSGYPQGLKGDAILLDARILAVADVIEAMASHRPYRPALGIEAALEEIEKNQGLLYDRNVVSVCLSLFRKQGYRLEEAPRL